MEPIRRRRRPAVACTLCRKRKMRCNRGSPCSNCIRSRRGECVYENHHPAPPQPDLNYRRELAPRNLNEFQAASLPTPEDQSANASLPGKPAIFPNFSPTASTTPQSDLPELEALKNKVKLLEDQLSKSPAAPSRSQVSTPASNFETTSTQLGGTFHLHSQSQPGSLLALRDILEIIDRHTDEASDLIKEYQKCKSLGKRIKKLRAPEWPTLLTTHLVARVLSDSLVECYLGTIEKLYRILHIPTFKKRYNALWDSNNEPDREFLVHLRLVHALGATTYDENFSLRSSAIQWIYEAQTWISEPEFKSRLGIEFLQTNILLLLAREIVAVGGETLWIACGSLLRTAMSMGLHRDPTHLPQTPTFACEMRRRIWNTIIEMCLQSSMTSGGSPMISTEDFDTEPPGNFDDEQIMLENPTSRPDNVFTQTSTARAMRKTYPSRLKVSKLLNDLRQGDSYQETLRLDSELKVSYKEAIRTLQSSKKNGISPTQFELSAMDFIMRRYLGALHFPFFGISLTEPSYAFSRKMAVETAFRLWSIARRTANDNTEFARFVVCSSGFFRTSAWLASVILLLDLRNQVQEDDTFSSAPIHADVFNMMEDSKPWTLQCIEAGETNIKGHLITSLVSAQIKGIMSRVPKEELAQAMIHAGEEAAREALVVFESLAAQLEPDGGEFQTLSDPVDFGEDWNLMLTDGFLNGGAADPMTWIF
ncbi:hypothetical protein FSPOR_11662 [Fusarium sporotrichioides]|uniref:Zn(2)-C6 fungal-type domain-containing protein n=1 Tax=Fusarium sporotrichioides TaxID=5514 RepID=A0A395RG07_FUSSP|nr:hypothetical protein FSPOR_11662 [Fusarium sporotrichioides]